MAPFDVVGFTQNLDGGALHGVPEFRRRGIDQRREQPFPLGRGQFARHLDWHAPSHHRDAGTKGELPLDLDLDEIVADQLPAQRLGGALAADALPVRLALLHLHRSRT